MTTRAALFALLALWGVGTTGTLPARADEQPAESVRPHGGDAGHAGLTDRVWIRCGESGLPGVTRMFLSDGTFVEDSPWDTFHLSAWRMTDAGHVSWTADGRLVEAEIRALTPDELVLMVRLKGGHVIESYRSAALPVVLPELPEA
jgi:hypothetical protein